MKIVLIVSCAICIVTVFIVAFLVIRETRKQAPAIGVHRGDPRVRSSGRLSDEYLKNIVR
jgi:hypothetical protein